MESWFGGNDCGAHVLAYGSRNSMRRFFLDHIGLEAKSKKLCCHLFDTMYNVKLFLEKFFKLLGSFLLQKFLEHYMYIFYLNFCFN